MDISVVCPFYNESGILEQAVRTLIARIRALNERAELIIVNDGSTDGSGDIAAKLALEFPDLVVLGYRYNRGRGYALRTGIAKARGELIVTTEIDLSWGDNIVSDLVTALRTWPDVDIVVASPHLEGGYYKNVPPKRVWLSRIGNKVIRACMSNAVTMNTGMTRGYRRDAILSLPLMEDGKEFHLEVILKALAFGFRIREIPAVLEWKDYKHKGQRVKRKSSSRVNRLIVSHSLFSIFANPVRYVWGMSLVSLGLGIFFLINAIVSLYFHLVAAYAALLSVSLVILGIILFVIGVVMKQGNMIQRELWILQRSQLPPTRPDTAQAPSRTADTEQGPRAFVGKR